MEDANSELTKRVKSDLTSVWRKKIDNDLTGKGSLRNMSLEPMVSPSELVEENVTIGEGTGSRRRNFDPESIKSILSSADEFFQGLNPPVSMNLMDFVNYNDPK